LALGIEELLLRQELEKYANSQEEVGVVTKGREQLQEAKRALAIVQNPSKYRNLEAGFAARNKEAGLPMDAMRLFLKSQSARLSNQRKENLGMVKEVYMAMQRKALGIPVPEKSQR
jgi:hypothetical protein